MIWCPSTPAAQILSISTGQQTITGPDFTTTNDNVDFDFDVGNQGGLFLDSFTTSTATFDVLNLPFDVTIQRSAANNKATLNYFLTGGGTNPVTPIGSRIYSMEEAFNSRDLSAGVENMFQNDSSAYQKNVERIDYVHAPGMTLAATENPNDFGFAFFERDGNNLFNVAAVTGIDGSGNVTSVGAIASFGSGGTYGYGTANLTGFDDTSRLIGTTADPNADLDNIISGQDLGGVFISLGNLGVSAGDTIYGYVLLAGDQGTLPGNINDFSSYNLNTNATNGGGDLYGGGMIFQSRNRDLYWDTNRSGGGAVNDNANINTENSRLSSGEWRYGGNTSETRWGNKDGNIDTAGWISNRRAIFSAGTDASDNTYTVTIRNNTTILASDLRLEEGDVTIGDNGGDTDRRLQLNKVLLNDPEIDVQNGNTLTIAASLDGTSGFVLRDNSGNTGTGKLVLTGNNNISGTATVEEGTLELAGSLSNGSLKDINTIDMKGGTLLLSATDEINNTGNIILNGGNITVSDNFDHSDTVGTLTLNENSTIDMGTRGGSDQSIINFAQSDGITWDGTKQWSITNWSGIGSLDGEIGVKDPTATGGGGSDQIYFGGDLDGLTLAQLSQIKFINPEGYAPGIYSAIILPDGEIVPVVPEASSVVALLTLLATFLMHRRRVRGQSAGT